MSARLAQIAALALVAPMALAPPAAGAERPTLQERLESEAGAPAASARRGAVDLAASAAAMGSRISGNPTVGSGRSAAAYLCTSQFPNSSKNDVVGTRGGTEGVLELGAVATFNRSGTVKGRKAVASFASAADIVLGEEQVRISGLQSFSQVIRTPRGFTLNSSVDVAALEVGGREIAVDLGRGKTTIPVPGFGSLIFNDVRRVERPAKGLVRTTALTAKLDDGTKIEVVRSKARLDERPDGVFRGGAWGSDVDVAGVVGSGRTAFVPMPCAGTDGTVNSNNTARSKLPAIVRADVQESVVRTRTLRNGNGEGVAFNRVANVDVGDGELTISSLESFVLLVRAPGGRLVREVPYSTVGTIQADGETYDAPVNGESLEIPGVATLTAGVIDDRRRGMKVTALRVELLGGAGAVVNLGVSKVLARN